jgi:polysaccharide export outer membrane protein
VIRRRLLGGGLLGIILSGCSATPIRGGALPPPNNTYTLGPGDRFELTVIGENFPKEYTVASNGTVDLPLLHRQNVDGFEAQDLASHLRQLLIDGKFLRDPIVIVNIKEFNSKRITVGGAVSKPGDYPYTPGLTLLRVISNAGGFTAVANRTAVLVTRRTPEGKRITASFSVDAISEGRTSDVPLQAGDNVYANERNF